MDVSSGESTQSHMVHVSPHVVVFDAQTHAATLSLSNDGDAPVDADLVLQDGFTMWRNQDTALFHPSGTAPDWIRDAYDTVVATPSPREHYAGRWLTGVPPHVHLAPHETRRITVRIAPPAGLPNGEYYVRLVTLSHPAPRRGGQSLDTKERSVVPVHGAAPPSLRDSTRIFYRQGVQTMGATFALAEGAIDTTIAAEDYAERTGLGSKPLRTLIKVHLTGTAHFEGYWDSYYQLPTGEHIDLTWRGTHANEVVSLHRDMIIRWLNQTSMLAPGHYKYVIRLVPDMNDFPTDKRLPMDTVQVSIPFDVQ